MCFAKADLDVQRDISAVLNICTDVQVQQDEDDEDDLPVQDDEPVVMVDNPVQADEAVVAPSMASVELHHQWKSHSLMVRAGNSMAWAERNMEWSPFPQSMSSVQDLLEDFSSLQEAPEQTLGAFQFGNIQRAWKLQGSMQVKSNESINHQSINQS